MGHNASGAIHGYFALVEMLVACPMLYLRHFAEGLPGDGASGEEFV